MPGLGLAVYVVAQPGLFVLELGVAFRFVCIPVVAGNPGKYSGLYHQAATDKVGEDGPAVVAGEVAFGLHGEGGLLCAHGAAGTHGVVYGAGELFICLAEICEPPLGEDAGINAAVDKVVVLLGGHAGLEEVISGGGVACKFCGKGAVRGICL